MSSISTRTIEVSLSAAVVALFLCAATLRAEAIPVYASGHCDLCADYDEGWALHYHFHPETPGTDENGNELIGEIEPSALYTRVPDAIKTTLPDNPAYSFLGASAGSNVWILPEIPTSGVPFLGFGTEELDPAAWPSGVSYHLVSASGPGSFSMWMNDAFGEPVVSYATSDGIDSSDVYTQLAGGHSHANWGFTAEGVYNVQLQLSGAPAGGATEYSGVETFTFLVGSSTVPEPGTIAMLSSVAAGGLLTFWRRSRNKRPR